MATEENKVHAHRGEAFHAQVTAKTFWRLVEAAEGLPDTASFRVWGTSESLYSEERYVKTAHIRHLE